MILHKQLPQILAVFSILSFVTCVDVVDVTEVLPNFTRNDSDMPVQNKTNTKTLYVFKPPDEHINSSNIQIVGSEDIKKVEYFEVKESAFVNKTKEIQEHLPSGRGVSYPSGGELGWLQNVYNPYLWGSSPPGELAAGCREDMEVFLTSLNNGSLWAAKMTDASGRYASQFFFGNDFWLGSYSLCAELELRDTNPDPPPFKVGFNVVRLKVALSSKFTPKNRLVFLGLCLPRSCRSKDITALLQPGNALQVIRVRPVPGEYSVLSDIKLHILGGVLIVISVLIAAGSCYELLLYRGESGSDQTIDVQHKQKSSPGLLSQMLLAFSAVRNGRKILNCDTAEDSLTSVHGLRFLSLAWVILVHTYLQVFAIAENKTLRTVTERNFMFQTISNATFSVDTFFLISGLLVTFLYYRTVAKQQQESKRVLGFKENIAKFFTLIFYRFVRLTPAYLFVLGLVEVAMRHLQSSSVFEPKIMDQLNCDSYWWRNALYINNLFPRREMCMVWSWYMANDTQFYVLGVLLLLQSVRHFRAVAVAWAVFLISSWCTTGFISYQYQYLARIQEPFAQFDALYDKPWTRVGPYLVGMGTGWILQRTNCNIKMPPLAVLGGWALSLLCLFSLVYGLLHVQLGTITSAVYVALGHTAWGLSLAWIIVACCTGYGGVINNLLSFRALYPLSRLTYCAYLTHPLIMVITAFSMDGPLHIHNLLVFILYLGNLVASFVLSFFISLAFEAPVVSLLKITMAPKRRNSNIECNKGH
ncbi:nose resistant to fluoxetine protein 6-like [Periplaneta americana]|uniref:nose resistant to fluoxetine protein 6-like n=1 Tax=Periplaneta americana TaxID=6978 RepID=UPI0037E975F4